MSGQYSMMTLGSYTFELDTAVYQEFKRTSEYLWPSQQRFGAATAVQSTGLGDETITLPGVIFPEWYSDTAQLDTMRALAAELQPQTMIDGRGNVLGMWVIERVEETQSIFAQAGVGRKQEFSLTLKKYSDVGSGDILESISAGLAGAAGASSGLSALPAVPPSLSALSSAADFLKTVSATANGALSTAATLTGKIGSALGSVAHVASALGIHNATITNALNRSLGVVNGIRTSASGGLSIMNSVQTAASAASAAKTMFGDVSSMVQPATNASAGIKASLSALTASGAPPDALAAVTGALVSANQVTALSSSLRDNTNTIINRIGPQ